MKNLLATFTTALVLLGAANRTNASLNPYIYIDDFEDGDAVGWLVTKEGGGGSHSVKSHNDSKQAFVHNYQSGKYSLSREFAFEPSCVLAFDMQALAGTGSTNDGRTTYSASGVTVSFESKFNLTLGGVSFCHATSSSMLPSNGYEVGNKQQHYEATFSEWAALAKVDPGEDIADLSIEFWTFGRTAQIPRGSSAVADVYFDNVQVVPEPATLLLLGLGCLGLVRRRR